MGICRISSPPSLTEWLEDIDPSTYLEHIDMNTDIFTFWDRIPDHKAPLPNGYKVVQEIDNIAAIPLINYDTWYHLQIGKKTRNILKKAKSMKVEARVCEINDDLIRDIERIYNYSPTRQGIPFNHYDEKFDYIKDNISQIHYPKLYVGVFYESIMIGFTLLLFSKDTVIIGQILSIQNHWDKSPNNVLISKAVEIACERQAKYLVYTKMHSQREASKDSLRDFKIHNGFEEIPVTRYYIPLSLRGWIILFLGLQHGILDIAPQWFKNIIYSKNGLSVRFRFGSIRLLKGLGIKH